MTAINSTSQTVFPVPQGAMHIGISRRDWLAAMALSGVVTQGTGVIGDRVVSDEERNLMLAEKAYNLADAMIIAAEKTVEAPA